MEFEADRLSEKLDFAPIEPLARSKTSLRMRYESEARVWLEKVGGLEALRISLGLSQRKICQLLLVDPSAWTRWSKTQRVPPQIIRSLQWYTELEKKDPAWAEWRERFLKREPDPKWVEWQRKIEAKVDAQPRNPNPNAIDTHEVTEAINSLKAEKELLNRKLERQETLGFGFKLVLLFNTAWILWNLIKNMF